MLAGGGGGQGSAGAAARPPQPIKPRLGSTGSSQPRCPAQLTFSSHPPSAHQPWPGPPPARPRPQTGQIFKWTNAQRCPRLNSHILIHQGPFKTATRISSALSRKYIFKNLHQPFLKPFRSSRFSPSQCSTN